MEIFEQLFRVWGWFFGDGIEVGLGWGLEVEDGSGDEKEGERRGYVWFII